MPQTFACPNCGASLNLDGNRSSVRCEHCGSTVLVPEAAQPTTPEPDRQVPDPSLSEVAALLRAGKRVQATHRYREITGASLKDAKLAMDQFLAGQPLRRPNLLR